MTDCFYTVLWIVVYSIPSFLIQLLLCFKAKTKPVRFIPVYIAVAGWLFTVDTYFNFSGIHNGWNDLAAFFIGCYVAIYTFGVIMAFAAHKFYKYRKNKKR